MTSDPEWKYLPVRRFFDEADSLFLADTAAQKTIIGGFKSMSAMDSETEAAETAPVVEREQAKSAGCLVPGDGIDSAGDPVHTEADSFDFL